ncbi:MAG: hypothetical protein NTZ74_12550 [Chloroflexi bacterium]|nr:hypothetical protein [Chloroflexota bacterium]
MRITRDNLLNLARENAARMAAKDHGVVCIFLTGSLLRPDPFIGGITDIDLVCVHDRQITNNREIVRINADVHLDVAHYTQDDFLPARKLRTDAWIGGALENGSLSLEDPAHWFDLTRSNATAQFWQPANITARARKFTSLARKNWVALEEELIPHGIKRTQALLDSIRDTANAVAIASGMPLPVRRIFMDLPDRGAKVGIPDITGSLVHLFSSEAFTEENLNQWLKSWSITFDALKNEKETLISIHPNRKSYYEKAIEALAVERPAAALWILLWTWTKAVSVLQKSEPSYREWQEMCKHLLLDSKNLPERLRSLDNILDRVEETIDTLQG